MTDPATRSFPTEDVLSVVTGQLVSERLIGAVYEVLNFMTGESLFTHQLPGVRKEAASVIVALHPALATAVAEGEQVTHDNWREWATRWIERYGPTLAVPRMTAEQHQQIDAISEAINLVGADKVVVVLPPAGGDPQ